MAILKCKMCGGDLNITESDTVAICEYCDTKQTVPTADNEKKMTLFARANRLRASCEFDKASGIYETIISDFPQEAEAYWGLVLCKYGIEYVDDPATGKKIPTCHRSSFETVMEDDNFELVMENSDPIARRVYREEAKVIEEIRKGIVEVSSKEEPYDIFICYKETDENGDRTIDSVLAQDIFNMLTEHDYRVFFARITLEDKLGQEYEPYIFAALNSARIMLAVGTDYEYYNAVWVKNEWSRFLQLMTSDSKKTLIPCFKNLDAYDIPKEFARLQAQDLGKIGAMQDLLRGVQKLLPKKADAPTIVENTVVMNSAADKSAPLLERGFMFLEDREWNSANEYFERVLDIEPKNAKAYLGKLLAEFEYTSMEELLNGIKVYDQSNNYNKIMRFGDESLKQQLENALIEIKKKHEQAVAEALRQKQLAQLEEKYQYATNLMTNAQNAAHAIYAGDLFTELGEYKDSKDLAEKCYNNLFTEAERKEQYDKAMSFAKTDTIHMLTAAINILLELGDWGNAEEMIARYRARIEQLRKIEAENQLRQQRFSLEKEKQDLEREYKKLGSFSQERKNQIKLRLNQIKQQLRNM